MSKKQAAITIALILVIFLVGFVLRVESTTIPGIPADEKAYYEDQNGLPYMYELDSYYNYRLTKNCIDHGYMGDTILNGREWDLHSYAPSGVPMDYPPLIAYLTALIYKFINLLTNIPLLTLCFWVPAFIGPLAGVVAYFFVGRFTNRYGAFAAGIFAVTAPFYFTRSVPGWFDTDIFNIFFPLLVTWIFVEAVQAKKIKIQMVLSVLAAVSMFFFALAWNGWQYQFYLLVGFTVLYILWRKVKKHEVKRITCVLTLFFVSTLVLVDVFTGSINVLKLFNSIPELLGLTSPQGPWAPWPDIYVSVSELGIPSPEEVMQGVGIAFFLGILGFICMFRVLINEKLKEHYLSRMTWFMYLLLIIWALIGVFSLTQGARFILLLIPPMVVSSGIMVGLTIDYLAVIKKNDKLSLFESEESLIKIISFLILFAVSVSSILLVCESFSSLKPGANDDLWDASTWINSNTPSDTIIISDWSYGHFLTAVADRPVSFDGRTAYIETLPSRQFDSAYPFGSQSPSTSREYWTDKAFVTDNESLSLGIFNMIATSGDRGYITLDKYTGNTTLSVEILNDILGVDKGTAKMVLINNYGLNQTATEDVLQYTHPSNPRHFVILTNGFSGLSWIFHFGRWDFNKMQGGNYTYSYGEIYTKDNVLSSHEGLNMDLNTGDVTWKGEKPYCVINVTDGVVEKHYIDKNSNICIVLLMDRMQSVVIDKQFENSTFTQLWLERINSANFKLIYSQGNVAVWEPL